jgi:hypothetical protein
MFAEALHSIWLSWHVVLKDTSLRYVILKDTFLWHVVLDEQLWTIGTARIAAIQTEIVGNSVVVIIQFEAQADLGQPGVQGSFVDIALPTGQVNTVPAA